MRTDTVHCNRDFRMGFLSCCDYHNNEYSTYSLYEPSGLHKQLSCRRQGKIFGLVVIECMESMPTGKG